MILQQKSKFFPDFLHLTEPLFLAVFVKTAAKKNKKRARIISLPEVIRAKVRNSRSVSGSRFTVSLQMVIAIGDH